LQTMGQEYRKISYRRFSKSSRAYGTKMPLAVPG
jgi:hypothetical protein